MKKNWLTIGVNSPEMREIDRLVNLNGGEMIPYIHDLHFAHYDSSILPTGRMPMKISKEETEHFLRTCENNGIATTLLLNYGNYKIDDLRKILESFYLPLGLDAIVTSNMEIVKQVKMLYPNLKIHGSCTTYIDTIDALAKEKSCGVELHNPAVWTIRNMEFIKEVNKNGFKQKQIISEGCARKCKLELWHRKESSNGNYHGLSEACGRSIPDIYTFLMGSWITMKQLKRMENYIDVLKLPRNTFDDITGLKRFLEIYDNDEPYNILEYVSTPLLAIKHENKIMSDVFDDAFFDNTVSNTVDKAFLDEYVSKITDIPYFKNKEMVIG